MPKIPKIKERRNLIDKHMTFLLSEIDSKHLYPLFYEKGKIDEDEMEQLAIERTTRKRNYKFLKFVKEKDPTLHTFFEALRKSKSEHVIDTLMSPGNEDEQTGKLENESCNVTSTRPEDFPTTYRGKLVFQSKEYCSDNNYRYCWMYFYLENINKTMKVVLFDTDVDRYNDLEENGMYKLKNLNIERHSQRVVYKDIRETFPFTAKLGLNSSIKLDIPQAEDIPIPDLQFMDIQGTKQIQEYVPVHIKAFVSEVMEVEKQEKGSTPALSVTIADKTGRMTVRIFDLNEGDEHTRKYLNKLILIDHGITKLNLQNGTMEIHVSRFTRVQLEDPTGGIPDFNSTEEEEAEPPFVHIEDFIKQSIAGCSSVVRTKAHVLSIRHKKSELVVSEHRKCGGIIETLQNRRFNCMKCNRYVRKKNRSLAYDMRAKIGKRKPCVIEHWMFVNKKSAEIIMGMSAEEFSRCKDKEKEKMIRNSRSILFDLKIMKRPNLKKPNEYIYNVICASDKSEESSDDSD